MSAAPATLEEVNKRYRLIWGNSAKLSIACEYIDNQQDHEAFHAYVTQHGADEAEENAKRAEHRRVLEAIKKRLVGRKIRDVIFVHTDDGPESHIILDGEGLLIPMRDAEGNGPGVLQYWSDESEEVFIVEAI